MKALFFRVGRAAEHTCEACSSLGDALPVAGASLLQARSERPARARFGELQGSGVHKIDQTCSLKSPWMSDSLRRDDMTFDSYSEIAGSQGLFVYPPNNFAFCLIEKNACATWISTVMQPLLTGIEPPACEEEDSPDDCAARVNFSVAKESQKLFGQQGMDSVFRDPAATRAVFVRDPMARFVSAFFNKCASASRGFDLAYNCIIPEEVPTVTRKFRDAVENALKLDWDTVNPHWGPQVKHCELETRIQSYNMISLIQKETFVEDMNCVLAKAGLERFAKPEHVQPWATTMKKGDSQLNSTMVLQKLFPPEVARQLINHMHLDYDVLGFPTEPEWLAGATGEWYDLVPAPVMTLSSTAHTAHSSRQHQLHNREDSMDLVELATRAGYAA